MEIQCKHCRDGFVFNGITSVRCSVCDGTNAMPMRGYATKREEYRGKIMHAIAEQSATPLVISLTSGVHMRKVETELAVLIQRGWVEYAPSVGFYAGIGVMRYALKGKQP